MSNEHYTKIHPVQMYACRYMYVTTLESMFIFNLSSIHINFNRTQHVPVIESRNFNHTFHSNSEKVKRAKQKLLETDVRLENFI
jgi:hypothetical protein